MVVALFSQPVARFFFPAATPDFSREAAILDSLEGLFREAGAPVMVREAPAVREAFSFNPNQAAQHDLERLGFPPGVARRIVRYRQSGGTFRKKSDLLRIYGMDTAVYERLYAYIELPERVRVYPRREQGGAEHRAPVRFDLNAADTSQLKAIRGIGSVLASRIVRYRERLGGFVSMNQLHEVFRLDSAAIGALRETAFIGKEFTPVKLDVNNMDEYHLSRHPYIGRTLARLIVTYRFQHGPFQDLEDLRQIHQVDDSVYRRISSYLAVD
ncbi:MAG TPA: helix-hairpin-helix domain-containing protein [Cyclobacteriaceae bacterium]|nr:helix-hairpin-helix domain-containing protein [Cyclobacteriaceae bacterium]